MKEILLLFFQSVIVLFTIASTLLAVYSFQNKLRLRNVRLSWRAGKLRGYPLFATVFLGLITTLGMIVYLIEDTRNFGFLRPTSGLVVCGLYQVIWPLNTISLITAS